MTHTRKMPTVSEGDLTFESETRATANGWEMDVMDSVITCQCGAMLEPDADHCNECGSTNPFRELGLI